ncbi:PHP domain-containing protein, partial [Spirochaetota bacterium]
MDFVHLHNHSDYSILDGAITVDNLIKRTVELGMPAVALTDHGNMFGAIDFYKKARKSGIIPIIGQEFYIAPGSRTKKEKVMGSDEQNSYHLILLAKNNTGYKNLLKLSSIGFTEGFYYKPRIDMEVLEKYSEGLICSSACIGGQIPSLILKGKEQKAREIAGRFQEIFGRDHFYLELQYHNMTKQETVNKELIKISSELNIPLIATNDAHYLGREDAYSHEVLLCIQTDKTIDDPGRMRFPSDDFYLKTPEEMASIFPDYPDALYNTVRISEMTDLSIDLGNPILPDFPLPQGYTLDSYLRHLVYEGAVKRYGKDLPQVVKERIEHELSVITSMHFSGY